MFVLIERFFLFLSRCGPQPNSKLLINYGFVDEDNSYDRMVVEVKFHVYSSAPALVLYQYSVIISSVI